MRPSYIWIHVDVCEHRKFRDQLEVPLASVRSAEQCKVRFVLLNPRVDADREAHVFKKGVAQGVGCRYSVSGNHVKELLEEIETCVSVPPLLSMEGTDAVSLRGG